MTFEVPKVRKHHIRTTMTDDFTVMSATDGTHTIAEVMIRSDRPHDRGEWRCIGVGEAHRRKGDTRNSDLGMTLAMQRAFQCAADNYAAKIERDTGEKP